MSNTDKYYTGKMKRGETRSIKIEKGRNEVADFTWCQERCNKGGDISSISSYSQASLYQTNLLPEDNQKT